LKKWTVFLLPFGDDWQTLAGFGETLNFCKSLFCKEFMVRGQSPLETTK